MAKMGRQRSSSAFDSADDPNAGDAGVPPTVGYESAGTSGSSDAEDSLEDDAGHRRGMLIGGRYQLARHIGRGGMGSVWVAKDCKLVRPVALKLVRAKVASKRGLARFEREAMAVARLRSPHIVQMHDYGIDDGEPFMVMELLDGADLRSHLEGNQSLNLVQVAGLVGQISRALATAHEAGIIHRDLKPANIFITSHHGEDIVKVVDFGLAKALGGEDHVKDSTAEGTLVGTPRFMSPEQVHGAKNVDHRADLWALAVIAYRCLTGVLPFRGVGLGELFDIIRNQPHTPPTHLVRGLPSAINDFFDQALAKQPSQRFQSALALAAALAALCNLGTEESDFPDSDDSLRPDSEQPPISADFAPALDVPAPKPAPATAAPKPNPAAPSPAAPEVDPGAWELDLELPAAAPSKPAAAPPRQASAKGPARGKPRAQAPMDDVFGDDEDELMPGSGLGDLVPQEEHPSKLRESLNRASQAGRERASQEPSSRRGIKIRRHAPSERPRSMGQLVLCCVLAVALLAGVPFLHDTGIGRLSRLLHDYDYVPLIASAAVLFVGCVHTYAVGFKKESSGMYLAATGQAVLAICLALTIASMMTGSGTSMAFRPWMPVAAPLALAAVLMGFSAYGLRRAKEELLTEDRRVSYGLLLLLLSLAGIVIGLRVARVDLPLPRIGEPLTMQLWTPLFTDTF